MTETESIRERAGDAKAAFGSGMRKTFYCVGTVVMLPATVAHELAHIIVALPFASSVGLLLYPQTHAAIDWIEDVPKWGVRAAQFAPLVLGLLIGSSAIVYALATGTTPETAADYLAVGFLAVYWFVFTKPSEEDLEVEA